MARPAGGAPEMPPGSGGVRGAAGEHRGDAPRSPTADVARTALNAPHVGAPPSMAGRGAKVVRGISITLAAGGAIAAAVAGVAALLANYGGTGLDADSALWLGIGGGATAVVGAKVAHKAHQRVQNALAAAEIDAIIQSVNDALDAEGIDPVEAEGKSPIISTLERIGVVEEAQQGPYMKTIQSAIFPEVVRLARRAGLDPMRPDLFGQLGVKMERHGSEVDQWPNGPEKDLGVLFLALSQAGEIAPWSSSPEVESL